MSAVAVYCGSNLGTSKAYQNAATSLGKALAKHDLKLVYGGGQKGLMGIIAASVLNNNGSVVGIIPRQMIESGGEGYGKVFVDKSKMQEIVVESMHERKVKMAESSMGFFALPGGLGTFEEVMEVATWTQIGIHRKPVILLNVLGFWNPLRELISTSIKSGFITESNRNIIIFVDGPTDETAHEDFDWGTAAINILESWSPENLGKQLFDWKTTDLTVT